MSSSYERGRRRERVLRGASLNGGSVGYLFNGYGASGYGEEVMERVEEEARGLVIRDGDLDVGGDVYGRKEGEIIREGV